MIVFAVISIIYAGVSSLSVDSIGSSVVEPSSKSSQHVDAHHDRRQALSTVALVEGQYLDGLGFIRQSIGVTQPPEPGVLHGTVDVLILKTLTRGPRHGYGIAKWIEEATESAIFVEEGSLYPALYRMERKGWIEATWGMSELGRKAKFYRLTPSGRRHLTSQTKQWARLTAAVSRVLLPRS